MTFGSLFAGIGGFDLGLERAGMTCKWQVEIDDYCRKVLAKHWPDVQRFGDIRTVRELTPVDLICGGFPCQDISNAGKRAGIDGERSGLWSEYVRLIRLVRPRYVVVENVAALLERGMERVAGDLAECGYDAQWSRFSACSMGAPHLRQRLFIVAYTNSARLEGWPKDIRPQEEWRANTRHARQAIGGTRRNGQWFIEPDVGRVAHGISARVDRLKGLGNAIVPQIAEWIGKQILKYEEANLCKA